MESGFGKFIFACVVLASAATGPAIAQVPTPCGIPAYPNPNVPTGQSALAPPAATPVIYFNPAFFNSLGLNGQPMFRYMLAHECSHHLNGDIVAGALNPLGMMMINPQVELRADCSAAQYLKSVGDFQAIQLAIQYWAQYGNMPTGQNYPTGDQRARMLRQCGQ
jgi:hypothetical protein